MTSRRRPMPPDSSQLSRRRSWRSLWLVRTGPPTVIGELAPALTADARPRPHGIPRPDADLMREGHGFAARSDARVDSGAPHGQSPTNAWPTAGSFVDAGRRSRANAFRALDSQTPAAAGWPRRRSSPVAWRPCLDSCCGFGRQCGGDSRRHRNDRSAASQAGRAGGLTPGQAHRASTPSRSLAAHASTSGQRAAQSSAARPITFSFPCPLHGVTPIDRTDPGPNRTDAHCPRCRGVDLLAADA